MINMNTRFRKFVYMGEDITKWPEEFRIKHFHETRDKINPNLLVPGYSGKITECMPEIIKKGLVPISVDQVMKQRILAFQEIGIKCINDIWFTSCGIDTGDSIRHNYDERRKIILDSNTIRTLNEKSLVNTDMTNMNVKYLENSLKLTEDNFNEIEGEEFSKKDFEKYGKVDYSFLKNPIKNPILLYLARGDKELLREYLGVCNYIEKASFTENFTRLFAPIFTVDFNPFDCSQFKTKGISQIEGIIYFSNHNDYLLQDTRLSSDRTFHIGVLPRKNLEIKLN